MKIHCDSSNMSAYRSYLAVTNSIEEFLKWKNYLKVDLPVLSPALIPESYLEVFSTDFRYQGKKTTLYLTPSPELFLKRLLSYGVGDCYYLGKSFRNSDPPSSLHGYEFTILEFYKRKADYMDIANEVLKMLQFINYKLTNSRINGLVYQGKKISLSKWEKISVAKAFENYAAIDESTLYDKKKFMTAAEKKGLTTKNFTYEDVWSQIYSMEVEPNLGKNGYPTLIYDYPKEFAALAKLNPDGKTTQRFEFYIDGIELGDCYSELIDWKEQEKRFAIENEKRKKNHREIHPIDKGYIEALKYGLEDCSGIAIGVERLAMIFTNTKSIKELRLISIE